MEENMENSINELKKGIGELLQRANSNNESPEKLRENLAGMILGDIKRTMEEKHNFIQEQLYSFENMVKAVLQNADNQKLLVETTRIASDLNTVYTKINAQEMLLQNTYKLIDNLKNDKTPELVERLNHEFISFSRGFENITAALNKNFTEFLAQVQSQSAKEEIKRLSIDLDGINSNTNAIISALAIIDHKYQDLKGLITLITDKESTFIDGLQELNRMGNQFNAFAESLRTLSNKDDMNLMNEKIANISTFLSNLRSQFETSDVEQRAKLSEYAASLEIKFNKLLENKDIMALEGEIKTLHLQFGNLSEEIKADIVNRLADFARNVSQQTSNSHEIFSQELNILKNNMAHLNGEIANLQQSVNENIENKTEQLFSGMQNLTIGINALKTSVDPLLENDLNAKITHIEGIIGAAGNYTNENFGKMNTILKEGLEGVQSGLHSYRGMLDEAAKENANALKELVDGALINIENLRIGTQLKQLAIVVEQNSSNIKETFEQMSSNFAQIAETTNIEVLKQLNVSIPEIADKLEIFKSVVMNETSRSTEEVGKKVADVIAETKSNAEIITQQLEKNNSELTENFNEQFSEKIRELALILREDYQDGGEKLTEQIKAEINNVKELFDQISEDAKKNTENSLQQYRAEASEIKEAMAQLNEVVKNIAEDSKNSVDSSAQLIGTSALEIKEIVDEFAKVAKKICENSAFEIKGEVSEIKETIGQFNNEAKKNSEDAQEKISEQINTIALSSKKTNDVLKDIIITSFDETANAFKVDVSSISKNVKEVLDENIVGTKEILKNSSEEIFTNLNENKNYILGALEETRNTFGGISKDLVEKIEKNETNVTYELIEQKTAISNMSSQVLETLNGANNTIENKLGEQKNNLDNLIGDIAQIENKLIEKFNEVLASFEMINQSSVEEVNETASKHAMQLQNTLLEAKEDVLNQIITTSDSVKVSIVNNCEKVTTDVSAKIANSSGLIAQNVLELKNTLVDVGEKTTLNFNTIAGKISSILQNGEASAVQLKQLKSDLGEKIDSSFDYSKIDLILTSIDKIKSQVQDFSDNETSFNELARVSSKTTVSKIEDLINEVEILKKSIEDGVKTQGGGEEINSDALKEFISGLEFLQSNFLDELKEEFRVHIEVLKKLHSDETQKIDEANIKKVIQDTIEYKMSELKNLENASSYSLDDVESDFAKLRLTLEQDQTIHLPERLDEIRNIGLENIRLNKKYEKQFATVLDWLDSTSKVIHILSEKVEKAEKLSVQEIKTRLIKSESTTLPEAFGENIEELRAEVSKKYQIQEMKIDNVDEKLATLIQRQGDIIDMKSFIDAFHESATQTKGLIARVEGIENQISTIQGSLEKILSYIEE